SKGTGQHAQRDRRGTQGGAHLGGRGNRDGARQGTGAELNGKRLGASRGEATGDDPAATADLADDVGVLDQILVDEDRELVLRVTLRVRDAVAREGTKEVAAHRIEGDVDVGEVGGLAGGAAAVGDQAAVYAGEDRLVARMLRGGGGLQELVRRGFSDA